MKCFDFTSGVGSGPYNFCTWVLSPSGKRCSAFMVFMSSLIFQSSFAVDLRMPTSEPVSPVLRAMSAASEISGAVWPSPTWQLFRFLGPCFSVNQTSWHSGSGLGNLRQAWHLLSVTEVSWHDARTRGVLPNLSPSSSSQPGGCVSLGLSHVFLSYGYDGLTETPALNVCCNRTFRVRSKLVGPFII